MGAISGGLSRSERRFFELKYTVIFGFGRICSVLAGRAVAHAGQSQNQKVKTKGRLFSANHWAALTSRSS